jgi:hypothetical protein
MDAVERLAALSQPSPQSLSRQEHDTITESKLVRKRTQAKQRSERESGGAPRPSVKDSRQVVDVIRKNSTARQHGPGSGAGAGGTPVLPPVTEQQQQQQPPPPAMYAMSPRCPRPLHKHRPRRDSFPTNIDTRSSTPVPTRRGCRRHLRERSPRAAPGQRTGSILSPALPPGVPDMEGPGASQPAPPQRAAGKGPTTFAEMAIQGVKLEEKECVIM